jgi:hypothetical protein
MCEASYNSGVGGFEYEPDTEHIGMQRKTL